MVILFHLLLARNRWDNTESVKNTDLRIVFAVRWDLESGLGRNDSEEIYHTTFGRELPLTPEE